MSTPTEFGAFRPGPYPVALTVPVTIQNRNRLTVGFRALLAIPHTLLVGPALFLHRFDSSGFLGAAAYLLAIVNWCAILIQGRDIETVRDFQLYYLRWRARAIAYVALLIDPYPPFGDGPYPVSIEVTKPPVPRDRLTVAFRIVLALPHLVLLFFIMLAWCVVTIIAWFAILFTRTYPEGMASFSLGAMRWLLRVEAYVLLLVDEYPPFALD